MDTVGWTLDVIDVAAPCEAAWKDMQGDSHVRRCGECRMNVYNLESMSREQAEDLVRNHEGRLCIRFFRRADGTILTSDCPVGLRALRRRAARLVAGIGAMVATLSFGSWLVNRAVVQQPSDEDVQVSPGPLAQLIDWIDPEMCFMGAMISGPIHISESADGDDTAL